jgi:hypothetical protein
VADDVPLLPDDEPPRWPAARPPARITLTLRDVGDPLTRLGYPARPAEVRLRQALKSLLRRFGFKEV